MYNSLRAFKYHVDALASEKLAEMQQILSKCNDATGKQIQNNTDHNDDDDEFVKIMHMHFPRDEYIDEEIIKDDVL